MDREPFDGEAAATSTQLTPRPAHSTGDTDQRTLNGTWHFTARAGEEPPSDVQTWKRHTVPGQWNYQDQLPDDDERGTYREWNSGDYEVSDDERGWYRRTITVPEGWVDNRVKLRFNGVYSDAVVWVNGHRVGDHVGGYTPFEVDVTDAVEVGDNVLDVGVSEHSIGNEMGQRSLGGGITRDVALLCVPSCHVSDLDIETTIDDARATVRTGATLFNGSDEPVDGTVRTTLTDPEGEEVAVAEREVDTIAAGASREIDLEITLDEFVTWNPEQPRLYDLRYELWVGGEHERIDHSIGIRQIDIEDDQLLVNGESVILRGVNWRESHPDYGQAVPAEIARRDAEQLREANINYVRTGHHPPSEAFVEACDEVGILVEMEAPIKSFRFEKAYMSHDSAYQELLCQQILETIERDKNRTSVFLWSLANESEWGPNFEAAARLAAEADPTRPTTFNWGMYLDDDVGFCDVANHHYPALRDSLVDLEEFQDFDRPVMFGEFCHLYCYNGRELSTDPGLRDDYVRVLERSWERVCELDAFAGAAIWAGLDHITPEFRWGVLDKYRRRRPEYYHVKKIYSPIELTETEWRDDGTVRFEVTNRSTFVTLADRRIEWEAGDASGVIEMDAAPGETGTAAVPIPSEALSITLRIRHPRGFTIDEFECERETPVTATPTRNTTNPALTETETTICLETDACSLTVDRISGEVDVTGASGVPIVSGLPALVATAKEGSISSPPTYEGVLSHRMHPWRCEDVSVTADGDGVVIEGGYYYDTIDAAAGSFVFTLCDDGYLTVEYNFELHREQTVRETGIALPISSDFETLSWARDARWSSYPTDHIGRPSGTATAFPHGDRPRYDGERPDRTLPWNADVTSNGSNDFRSTKRNILEASLTDETGRTVELHSDGDQHVRCAVQNETVDLLVLDRSLAGVGLSLLDRHTLLEEDSTFEAGATLRGTATIRVSESVDAPQ